MSFEPVKNNSQNNFSASFASPNECTDTQALEKIQAMNSNRKGIGSSDIFVDTSKNSEISGRLNSMAGATSIGSDSLFGNPAADSNKVNFGQSLENNLMGRDSNTSNTSGNYEEYKEAANRVYEKAGEKASQLKDKAMDWFS
jgi:hypothetical protein